MAYITLNSLLTAIANAIRAKKGTTAQINAQNFPSEIARISTGATNLELVDYYTFDYSDGYQGTRTITATSKSIYIVMITGVGGNNRTVNWSTSTGESGSITTTNTNPTVSALISLKNGDTLTVTWARKTDNGINRNWLVLKAEQKGKIKMKLNDKTYDILCWIGRIVLPSLAVLYTTLGDIQGLPYTSEIPATIIGLDVFLNALLGISANTYYKEKANQNTEVYGLEITPLIWSKFLK